MASPANKPAPKCPSGSIHLQVVGTDTVDTTPSLLITSHTQRYLFNCGEGTQRLFNEHKIRLSKLNNIFFTQVSWEYVGGLPGLAMTLRDNGKSSLKLFGPHNIKHFIKATRFFTFQEKFHFDFVSIPHYDGDNGDNDGSDGDNGDSDDSCVFRDENMTVSPVLLTENAEQMELNPLKRIKLDNNFTWTTGKSIVCYICELPVLPGKFLPRRAKDLGIPPGPLFGRLKAGEDITLDNGLKVLANEVTEPSQPGPVVFIIDCPSTGYITSLVQSQQFVKYEKSNTDQQKPCLLVHLVPMRVFNDPLYTEWRQRFGSTAQHLLINREVCSHSIAFQSQARIQTKLHAMDNQCFPLLYHSNKPNTDPKTLLPNNAFPGIPLLKFNLRPYKQYGLDQSNLQQPLDITSIINETTDLLEYSKSPANNPCQDKNQTPGPGMTHECLLTEKHVPHGFHGKESNKVEVLQSSGASNIGGLQDNESHIEQTTQCEPSDFEVVFVGTGASLPSKYRNVSATLLNVSDGNSVLLDCGEGTLGQLFRHYGNSLNEAINKISCIFISHIHADHHLGLVSILLYNNMQRHLNNESTDEILVIGPSRVNMWLQEYSLSCQELCYRFIDCSEITKPNSYSLSSSFSISGAKQITAVPVNHCPNAYGLVIKHKTGWKIVYSGDTRPCPALIQAGMNATLLIHEATFEDELQEEAIDKKHSTTTEAINSGIQMKADFIMLNHFSQRYPKIPVFSEQFSKQTGIAFDHMRVRRQDFPKIPTFLRPLNVLFATELKEMSKRTIKGSATSAAEDASQIHSNHS